MKKRRFACALMALCFLSACGSAPPDEGVAAHFSSLDSFNTHVKITSDLGKTTLDYELDYEYHKEGNDVETITAPECIAGVRASIAGTDNAEFSLQYEDTAIDDGMAVQAGITPADCVFCLMNELQSAQPLDYSKETVNGVRAIALRYEQLDGDETITRRVWLRQSDFAPLCAEIYRENTRVLTLSFSDFQSTT